MAETFEIIFSTTGQSEAVAAFEELKLKELEAKEATSKLGTELRKLQRSGTATATEIEDVSRSMIRAKESAAGFAREASRTTQTMTSTSLASLDAGQKMNQLGSTIGQVGAVLSRVNPKWSQMGGALAGVGAQIPALTGALGPLAQGIAIVTIAVDFGTIAFNQYAAAADEAARLAHNLLQQEVEGIDRLVETRRQARLTQRLESDQATQAEITTALAAAEELEERRAANAERLGQNLIITERRTLLQIARTAEVQEINFTLALHEHLVKRRRLRQRFADETVALAEATAEAQRLAGLTAIDAPGAPTPPRAGGGGGQRRDVEAEEARRAELETRQIEAEGIRFLAELREEDRQTRLAREAEVELQIGQIAAQEEANRLAALDRIGEARREEHEERLRQNEEMARQVTALAEESAQKSQDLVLGVQGSMNQLVGQTISFLQEGGNLADEAFVAMLDSFLAATAVEYTIRALAEGGQALAAAARQDWVAAPVHATAAGVYAAVAALAGGAAAAIPNVPSQPAEQVQAAAPLGGGGTVNQTVNLFAPNAVFTESERGEIIANGMRALRRERGAGSARV